MRFFRPYCPYWRQFDAFLHLPKFVTVKKNIVKESEREALGLLKSESKKAIFV